MSADIVDDLHAAEDHVGVLASLLDLPEVIADIFRRNTDSDGWDIVIMEEIAALLKGRFGIDLDIDHEFENETDTPDDYIEVKVAR